MVKPINVAIDGTGRIVLPKAIREALDLHAGTLLRIRVVDGIVELDPAPKQVRLMKKGRLAVAYPEEASEPLSQDIVNATIQSVREER